MTIKILPTADQVSMVGIFLQGFTMGSVKQLYKGNLKPADGQANTAKFYIRSGSGISSDFIRQQCRQLGNLNSSN
ncbi:MAG: hypothetical protein IPL63_19830 [Saprospiraceae bacterium]|nr:hypothetical protein [Saprospiraceae bacterium]